MRKRRKQFLACCILLAVLLCGCRQTEPDDTPDDTQQGTQDPATEPDRQEPSEEDESPGSKGSTYEFTDELFLYEKDFLDHVPKAAVSGVKGDNEYFQLTSIGNYAVMQGGCTDGTYMYLVLENQTNEMDIVFKVDMSTWEVVAQSEPLALDHANGMTYNPKLDRLIVAHNSNYPKDISFLDPDTLTITDRKTIGLSIYGIAYHEERDLYVVGISNKRDFAILDSDFKELGYFDGHEVGLTNQSLGCDDNYIFIGNTGVTANPGVELVKIYDWSGEYKGIFRIDSVSEHEAIICNDGIYYVTFFTGNGGRVYQIDFDLDLLEP